MSLLEMSFQGGVLILITALLRAGMKNRLPRSTFFALWMVVVARLLLPVSLPSACSAYTAAEQSPVLRENLAPVLRTVSAAGVPSGRDAASPWAVLWAVGAIALALYFITGYLHFRQKYRFSLPVEDGFAMQWMLEHPLRRPVSLRQSDQLDTPLTYGILRPVILLPKKIDQAGAGQLSYILAHEMMHIRHFDTVWKLLSTMALCLHWFNPLVWLLCALLGRDLELLCDACVVQHFGESSKSSYAMTLIHMEERKSGLLPFGSYFSKTAIEERISAIMRAKKASIAAIVAATVLVVAIPTVFATSAAVSTQMLPEDVKMLQQFQFPGWESMSIAEFRERANILLDDPQTLKWYEEVNTDDQYYCLKDDDPMCKFLYDILNEMSLLQWKAVDYGGAVTTDYPWFADQAVLEYFFTANVLDAERLTVSEYRAAVDGVYADIDPLLSDVERDLLANQDYMEGLLAEKLADIAEKWSRDSLRISISEYSYMPLTALEDGTDRSAIDGSVPGKRSDIDLNGYTESEEQRSSVERSDYVERRYPPATQADYDSLLRLKTADYSSMKLETFNRVLMDWADADYERMERVGSSTESGEVENANLTAEEKTFIALTVRMSGAENGMQVRSLHTGNPEEDPSFTGGDFVKQTAADGKAAWSELYYQFSYHISDRAAVTVGERDRCVEGFLNAVQRFWEETPLEDLLRLSEAEVVSHLQELAAQNSTQNVAISTDSDRIYFESMNEQEWKLD